MPAVGRITGGPDVELSGNDRGLVTFAVPEESRPFLRAWRNYTGSGPTPLGATGWRFSDLDVLVTGMGSRNAKNCIEAFLRDSRPRWVVTAGFAGGLDSRFPRGTIGISSDPGFLDSHGAGGSGLVSMTFHQSVHVVETTAAKAELHRSTGCHAVDMESATIRGICQVRGIPTATLRVISDDAGEDLAMDFGSLLGPDDRMDWVRLALTLMRSPSLIPRLIRFQGRLKVCADSLAEALVEVLGKHRIPTSASGRNRMAPPSNRTISN